MVRLWVANTDYDWFSFLASQPGIDEVNFWQPSGWSNFQAIQPGELFLFRLKAPRNVIAGHGVFQHSTPLTTALAWEAFGVKNGASSLTEMRARVARYRKDPSSMTGDYTIGCRIVVQPVFLPETLWIPQPRSWASAIVVGKTFGTDGEEGRELWDRAMAASAMAGEDLGAPAGVAEEPARYGEPALIRPRLGQGAFRVSVIDAYHRQCAISGGKVLPALEAAHIRPYAEGGSHEVANGILLRRDIHSVFDAGYVTIDPDLRFVVSDRVRTEFNNGQEYRRLHGSQLIVPEVAAHRPDGSALAWHNSERFLG